MGGYLVFFWLEEIVDERINNVYTNIEVINMIAKIKRWGNSQGIRLSKDLLESVKLHENDCVEIRVENECIIIKGMKKQHRTLAERIADYTGDYECTECQTGERKGREV